MYSILTFLVTAKIIDLMIEGFEDYVGLMIVSEHSSEIENELIKVVGTGVTMYKGARGYGHRSDRYPKRLRLPTRNEYFWQDEA